METDAKGQLGGLDTNEAERRRWAERSTSWKCLNCNRSNEDILKECSQAAKEKEAENGGGSNAPEEVVPPEMKIGYKDDLRDKAEGGPEGTEQPGTSSETTSPGEAYPPARPGQGVPQPTGTLASGNTETPGTTLVRDLQNRRAATPAMTNATLQDTGIRQRRESHDGAPVWIDRAIAGLVVCLVFMVTKVALGI
jgi:ubiquitin-conjugating enzyme E2 J1